MDNSRRHDYSVFLVKKKGEEKYVGEVGLAKVLGEVEDKLKAKFYGSKDDAVARVAIMTVEEGVQSLGGRTPIDVERIAPLIKDNIKWEVVQVFIRYIFGSSTNVEPDVLNAVNEQIERIREKVTSGGFKGLSN